MVLAIVLSSIIAFGAGRITKPSHETLVVEKLDGTTEVRESKAPGFYYNIKRDVWGDVVEVETRRK